MRPVDYIALSIPVFFLLIFVEWCYAWRRGEKLYRLNDSIADLSTGVLDQVLSVFTKAITVGAYAWVFDRFRLTEWSAASAWTWVFCFVGADFFYYWFHRVSHERNLPWGAHIVHHSSEEYNLSVALRQGAFQSFWSFPFYLPLALGGFPPLVFLTCSAFDTLYQFWIHTRTIGKLGPLEWVLNTPSHHRVHHGRDDQYIDKNYAGVFIVWDRLFGTFTDEREEPRYGITRPLANWNPLWANFHHYVDLVRWSRHAPSLKEMGRLWWHGPGWKADWLVRARSEIASAPAFGYDSSPRGGLRVYAVAQFVLALLGATWFLFAAGRMEWVPRLALALAVVWAVGNVGGFFDRRRWSMASEWARLVIAVAAVAAGGEQYLAPLAPAAPVIVLAAVGLSAAWLVVLRSGETRRGEQSLRR